MANVSSMTPGMARFATTTLVSMNSSSYTMAGSMPHPSNSRFASSPSGVSGA